MFQASNGKKYRIVGQNELTHGDSRDTQNDILRSRSFNPTFMKKRKQVLLVIVYMESVENERAFSAERYKVV